ncbi:MAG: hypothetical protein ACLFQM_08465 [Fidelibacterota bacterium]
MTKRILITAAIKDELTPTREIINSSPIKTIKTDYLITGIGRNKTLEKLNRYFASNTASGILNIGTCGSLNKNYKKKQLIMPTSYIAMTNNGLQQITTTSISLKNPAGLEKSLLFTSQKALYQTEEKTTVRNKTGADIVDMEAFWIAEFCIQHNMHFNSLKVISDEMQDFSLTEFKQELRQDAQLLAKPVEKIIRTIAV